MVHVQQARGAARAYLAFCFLARATLAFKMQRGLSQGVLLAGYVLYAAGGKLL